MLTNILIAQNDALNQPFQKNALELNLLKIQLAYFPSLSPIHPGINITGASSGINEKLQLKQDVILGFFIINIFKM